MASAAAYEHNGGNEEGNRKMGKFAVILIVAMLIAGCKVGGGSGSGSHFVHNPEPSSLALFGVGLAGLAMAKLRKRKKAQTHSTPSHLSSLGVGLR